RRRPRQRLLPLPHLFDLLPLLLPPSLAFRLPPLLLLIRPPHWKRLLGLISPQPVHLARGRLEIDNWHIGVLRRRRRQFGSGPRDACPERAGWLEGRRRR
ncbi:hypothetical protein AAT19DRAFT_11386, partial [Rhodotorula toruloides]